ncbi:MAG: formate dehydrogenase subunit alpha [Planctomycetota bacterium]|nr:MAG: formate dehydrogenase subunit alpha [Planctomycetota bacterium]
MQEVATIDGQPIQVRLGETILEAARRLGIELPVLCHAEGLEPDGGCRLCLVEVSGRPRPLAACTTALEPGMQVHTHTERLVCLRRDLLGLILSEHAAGRFAAGAGRTELEALMERLELEASPFGHRREPGMVDNTHPYLRFDPAGCVLCRRCLHACEEIQGRFVWGIEGRGGAVRLIYGAGPSFADSPCVACGACVERCPTGALTDRDRLEPLGASAITDSVCGYCGVGCRVRIASRRGRVLWIDGVPEAVVNRGHLCAKGRYAHDYRAHPERLLRPLRRQDGELQPLGWPEAIRWLAEQLRQIRVQHGPQALGAIASSRSTNEAAYLLQKLFRVGLDTNHVDCCARVCHASTALALSLATGLGAATACYEDIERAPLIVVAGANPTEAHPVLGARIARAVRGGVPLIVIDPRRIELAELADVHLMLRPGTNVAVFHAIARCLLEAGAVDRRFIEERLEGFAELERGLQGIAIEQVAQIAQLEVAQLVRAAEMLGRARRALFVHGLGLSEQSQGTAAVLALANLALLTGSVGRVGSGLLPLRGQNNVQGAADMGCMPDRVTGYQRLDDPAVRARLRERWGKAPPEQPGLTIPEMLEAAARGELRALWVQGEDLAHSEADQGLVERALGRLQLLVVQDPFPCATTRYAHLVLPAATALEQDGTFTNGERRIQRVRPAVAPPGEARPDWEVVLEVARALGLRWDYRGPADVMEEIARVAPQLFGGVSYRRLEASPDGLCWPCTGPDDPGTRTLHASGFARGRGRLFWVEYAPPPEHDQPGYPFVLITGRVLHHYNTGTMSRRTAQRELLAGDVLEIHPEDAAAQGLRAGEPVGVVSRWGRTRLRVQPSARVARGTLFASFHDPASRINALVGPHRDPHSQCPDYKVVAVRLERLPQ